MRFVSTSKTHNDVSHDDWVERPTESCAGLMLVDGLETATKQHANGLMACPIQNQSHCACIVNPLACTVQSKMLKAAKRPLAKDMSMIG